MAFENIATVPMPSESHLAEAGFDPVARVILIRFKNGGAGVFHGATQEEFDALVASQHPGQYVHRVLKPKYGWERI
jgi:hypothetical protein